MSTTKKTAPKKTAPKKAEPKKEVVDNSDTEPELFPIEEDQAVPSIKRKGSHKYPFDKLAKARKDDNGNLIGSTFFIPNKTTADIAALVTSNGKRLNKKFTSRTIEKVIDGETVTGVGIWYIGDREEEKASE